MLVPKDDGEIRVTLGAKNVNKALLSSNFPIPRQEDIKTRMAGCKVFSKLDLRSAYWQLEIDEKARHMTVFHAGGKLYRYKRLVMGLKPSQGELNAALQPLFASVPEAHVIHDDIVIATADEKSHVEVVKRVLDIVLEAGLTLNEKKCHFGSKEINFWGLIISSEGVKPDPLKIEALNYLTAPKSKEELISFLCMMQSNSDFIPGFSRKASILRDLTKKGSQFKWQPKHEECFRSLLSAFKKDVLLRFFDSSLETFVFVDGHKSGIAAILAQGTSLKDAKPVAVASRSTSPPEQNYPQLDIEAASLDFGLKRFREYLVGSPKVVKVITDHKPLVGIFNGNRKGSIRTQRVKFNHQDIPFVVEYQKGSLNSADIMSRKSTPLKCIPGSQQKEVNELNNLLYALHTTPIVDHISLAKIAQKTMEDEVLTRVTQLIKNGSRKAASSDVEEVKKFNPILDDLSLASNGIILKEERMVLPKSLQDMAIALCHRGAHPGRSGIERRLRYHFFFHGMFEKVKKFVSGCPECLVFVDKKTKEPLVHHEVPSKSWETVAVDLFGPMPSSKHVVVVQDLGSRYPAAKLVSSTKASDVIPALDEVYGEYGFPERQISDNGPPFNSGAMKEYAKSHDIEARFSAPYTPNQNPAETFMKTVGKAMKVANYQRRSEEKALKEALRTYRQTPHPATGVPPANYLFRDGVRTVFPRKPSSGVELSVARDSDLKQKQSSQEKINGSKYVKSDPVSEGDLVLARNYSKKSKFDPLFLPNPFLVVDRDDESKRLVLEDLESSRLVARHVDDVKGLSTEGFQEAPDSSVEVEGSCEEEREQGNEERPFDEVPVRRSSRVRTDPVRYPNLE